MHDCRKYTDIYIRAFFRVDDGLTHDPWLCNIDDVGNGEERTKQRIS